jgi:hypothetical protein
MNRTPISILGSDPQRQFVAPTFEHVLPHMLREGGDPSTEVLSLVILASQCRSAGEFSRVICNRFNAITNGAV